jgi:hypothetical protein
LSSHERALRTVLSQVQFEIAQAAARVAESALLAAKARKIVDDLADRCTLVARELRRSMASNAVNPAQLAIVQRLYQFEAAALESWQRRQRDALRVEDERRLELAQLRHRDRSLQRALGGELQRQANEAQRAEFAEADDLWAQRTGRAVA